MADLDEFARLGRDEQGLAVVSTVRADGSAQASLVNAGVMPHLVSGKPAVAFVTYGKVKLANLRRHPQMAIAIRSGWRWATVEGRAEIIGPDDPHPAVDGDRLRLLLREVFSCAGGTHDDWAEYDRVMADQRRAIVLVKPDRIYSNPA